MAADLIGGRYRLDNLLGQGAMSEVWCADDLELGRRVALKLLAPDADRKRFAREARAAAALAHPNITQLYDYGEADGRPFMVLEYLPGGTLEERLEPGVPLADDETTRVANDLAAGLAHAHARGLVHRDLKPANVLFDAEGRAKIADFGIARLGQGGTLTEAGTVLGTAAYISPEQASGESATSASDVYSFGVMLYRLLAGRLPFVSDDAFELVTLHRDATPPRLEDLRPDVPPALAAVATAALAKEPARRPRDGAAIVAALAGADEAGLGSAPVAPLPAATDVAATAVLPHAAPVDRTSMPPAPPRRRRAVPFAIAGVLALLGAGGAALAFTMSHSDSGPTAPPTELHVDKVKPPKKPHRPATAATIAAVTAPTTVSTSTATTTTRAATTTRRTHTTTSPGLTIAPPPTEPPVTTIPPAPTDTTTLPTTTGTTTGP